MTLIWLICDQCKARIQTDETLGKDNPLLCAACASARPTQPEAQGAALQWYYVSNRQKVGPVGFTQLHELVAAGQLKPSDMLLPVGASRWVAAETVEPLFRAKPQATVEPWPASVAPLMSELAQTIDDPGKASGETTDFHARPASPTSDLPNIPGYRIVSILGRGGMGIVYRAENLTLKRPVALKMILARGYAGEQEQQRFLVEAESVARLQHPNIVQIHQVGEHDGWPFLALELVAGGSLASRLQGNPWPAERAASLVEQMAKAMQHAHDAGIVHRDLKPANVLLSGDDTPKITDFGLAKKLDDASGLTQTGAVMGTPSYMAPEQAEGKVHDVGPLADVYALGAVLYELLTGRPPFKAAGVMETLDLVRTQEPVSPRLLNLNVPRDLETICLKCLNKETTRRYASAAALAEDLRRFRAGEPIAARPVGSLERAVKWTRRNPAVASLMAAVLGSLLLGTSVATYFAIQASDNAERERLRAEEAKLATDRANLESAEAIKQATRADLQAKANLALAEKEKTARVEAEFQALRVKNAHHALQLDQAFRAWQQYDFPEMERILGEVEPRFQQTWETRFIRQLIPHRVRELIGHTEGVNAVAVSGDGKRIVSGGDDSNLHLWDAETGQILCSFNGHTQAVTSVALGNEDRLLVSASKDKTITLWDMETGKVIRTLTGHGMQVTSVAISRDGKRIVSGGYDRAVRVWETETGREIHSCLGHTLPIRSVAFSDDGKRIASCGFDRTVRVWDAETGKEKGILKGRDTTNAAFTRDGKHILSSEVIEKPIPGGLPGAFRSVRRITISDVDTGAVKSAIECQMKVGTMALSRDQKRLVLGTQMPENSVHVWDLETGRELYTLRGHTQYITSLALSDDGMRIVSGSADKCVRIWNLDVPPEVLAFREAKSLYGHAMSGDGKHIVTASSDQCLALWDAHTGREVRKFPRLTTFVHSVAISSNGKRIVSGIQDGTVVVWDAETGQPGLTFRGHTKLVQRVALSGDGKLVVSTCRQGLLKIWDAESGQEKLSHQMKRMIGGMALSRDGRRLVVGIDDGNLTVWNAESGEQMHTFQANKQLFSGAGSSHCLAISGDGRYVAALTDPNTIGVWEADSEREVHTLRGHTKPVIGLAITSDNRRIISGGGDNTLRLWDMETGQEKLALGGSPKSFGSVMVSKDGRRIVSLGGDNVFRIWEANPEPEKFFLRNEGPVLSLALSGEGKHIVSAGGSERTVKVWDVEEGREVRTLHGHTLSVDKVALSGDGNRIVSGGDDKTIKIWDRETGKEIRKITGLQGAVLGLAISRDGRRIVSLDTAGRILYVRIWDAETGREQLAFTGKGTSIIRIALSDNGRHLATASADRVIRILDADSGREIQTFSGHTHDISSLAFSGDGRDLVSGSRDRTVRVWDVATGMEKFTLKGHGDVVHTVAFCRDGRRIVSGSQDRSIKVWDARTGLEIRTLHGHRHGVYSVALSEDGCRVVSGSWDHTIRVWGVNSIK